MSHQGTLTPTFTYKDRCWQYEFFHAGMCNLLTGEWYNRSNDSEDVDSYNNSYEMWLGCHNKEVYSDVFTWRTKSTLADSKELAVQWGLGIDFSEQLFKLLDELWELMQKSKPFVV